MYLQKIEDLKTAKEVVEKQLNYERVKIKDLKEKLNEKNNELSNERNKNRNLQEALQEETINA